MRLRYPRIFPMSPKPFEHTIVISGTWMPTYREYSLKLLHAELDRVLRIEP